MVQGLNTKDVTKKKEMFLKVLELEPDHRQARLNLAKCYKENKNYKFSREYCEQLISNPETAEFIEAIELLANAYYKEKDYAKALEYYTKSWEYSACNEYNYKTAYYIANCHFYMKDQEKTINWYRQFLDGKWEPQSMLSGVAFAKKQIAKHTAE